MAQSQRRIGHILFNQIKWKDLETWIKELSLKYGISHITLKRFFWEKYKVVKWNKHFYVLPEEIREEFKNFLDKNWNFFDKFTKKERKMFLALLSYYILQYKKAPRW